jgi:aspartyl-tRNA(Asn)/glutamyl-tRNA(Gln) amidotransferase subunit C
MAKISEDDVRHVALLSRLYFTDQEIRQFTHDLNSILSYVEKLRELDTEAIEPTSHSLKLSNVVREDIITSPLTVDEALANAPEAESGCFRVPKVIQEY